MIRYHARWVLPVSRPPIEDGTVVVNGRTIAYVGHRDGAPAGDDHDLGDAILLPGLVNAHTHLELTVLRGFLEDLPFHAWVRRLQSAKREALSRDMLLDSARLGITEGLLAGTTTYADTCDSGVALQAMREFGVRGIMYQEVFGPDPSQCGNSMAELQAKLSELRKLETELQRIGISPHAPYTVSDPLFMSAAAYAHEHALPMAIHIAESLDEHELVTAGSGPFAESLRARGIAVEPRGRSPIGLLASLGVLDVRPLLIHCVKANDADIGLIASSASSVAHCPASNAKLGHGVAPLLEMLDAGIAIGLGSDSMASNNRMHLLEEARLAALVQRSRSRRPDALPARRALELATMGGARALRLDDHIGSLDIGKDADLAAFPLTHAHNSVLHHPEAYAVFALGGTSASFVTVAGTPRVRNGRVLDAEGAPAPPPAGRVRDGAIALRKWSEANQRG